MLPKSALLPVLICLAAPLPAQRVQAPDAPWKTISTAHYRIHYPSRGGFEPFALEVASKIEGIHSRVTAWVGYESPRTVDVLIRDPLLEGNGSAFTALKHPLVELWKTPPEADSSIGHFTTWPELLVAHELTHIHHLTRPATHPEFWAKWLRFPVGPIAYQAPRWVVEGYATVIEGRVTGSGRPHSVYRAALLRQWAREGKLPDYGALNGTGGFRGGDMAYLVGSAYLEWLERKELARPGDPGVLKKLWRKLAADRGRGFEPTFLGTFGFSAKDGYDRFRAELSADALAFERRMKDHNLLREGEMFTKVDGEVTDLSVSPDGAWLLARVITPGFKGLRVWDLDAARPSLAKSGPPKTTAPDPDIAPRLPVKKPTWGLGRRNGSVPEKPFWAEAPAVGGLRKEAAGKASSFQRERILFSVREPDDEGVLHRRQASWQPGTSRVDRAPWPAAARPQAQPSIHALESEGLRAIWKSPPAATGTLDAPPVPIVRTPSAAWLPAPQPDGKAMYYVQLGATGCEIRKLDLTLPPLAPSPIPWNDSFFAPDAVKPKADEASELPPPVGPPPAHDYSVLEAMWTGLRAGLTLAPAGKSSELGYGGIDLIGRFSWQILGAAGNVAGPRGAEAGMVYRGWRWAPGLQVFSSLERPSRQQFEPTRGFDRQRTGGELAFSFESKNSTPAFVKPVFAFEQVQFKEGLEPSARRRFIGLDLGIAHAWSRGEAWGIQLSARARGGSGQTDGDTWQSRRGHVQARIYTPWAQLGLKAETARVDGDPALIDRLHLGGLTTSLTPASLDWNRIEQPALPSYRMIGDRMQRLRAEVGSGLRAYIEHTAVWDQTKERPAFLKVAGIEVDFTQLLGRKEAIEHLAGRMALVAGIHRVLNDAGQGAPMQGRTVGTLSLVLRL